MNEQLNHIRQLINEGHVDTAISRLNDWLQTASSPTAEAYYLLGNAYRKKGDWKQALDNYQFAIDINPDANPQIDTDGTTVLVGKKWEPGVNPYSIGRDSDVVKAFGKHGWTWGAGFSRADMMHFDY